MKKTRKKGFTIVELVIVIAVIAILAAVLIPTFTGVINNARESAAQSEAKNLWTEYCVENAESFADFDGYVKVEKNSKVYYFTVTDGQLDIKTYATEAPNTLGDPVAQGSSIFAYKEPTTSGENQG